MAIACAFAAAATQRTRPIAAMAGCPLRALFTFAALSAKEGLEAVRVLADSRNDQAPAVHGLEDRHDVQREDADPGEHEKHDQHAPEAEGRETDQAAHQAVGENHD